MICLRCKQYLPNVANGFVQQCLEMFTLWLPAKETQAVLGVLKQHTHSASASSIMGDMWSFFQGSNPFKRLGLSSGKLEQISAYKQAEKHYQLRKAPPSR